MCKGPEIGKDKVGLLYEKKAMCLGRRQCKKTIIKLSLQKEAVVTSF